MKWETESPMSDTPGRFTPRGLIPRRDWLARVWYPREIYSPGFDTPWKLTPRGLILRTDSPGSDTPGRLTPGLWYSGETDSPGSETPGRLTHQGLILWGDWLPKVWYSWEIDSPGNQIPGRFRKFNYLGEKYFNPWWPRGIRSMKKSEGRKSRWTSL